MAWCGLLLLLLLLFVVCCLLFVVCCLLFVVCCLLFVVCCVLCVVCCVCCLFVVVVVVTTTAWYLISEIRGLRKALYSWRDLCNDMDSDDREVRRRAMRRFQRSRRMMTPSTYEATEAERDGLLQDFAETGGVWIDRGPMNHEDEIPLRVDALRSIGQHMQLNTRENTIFIRATQATGRQ